MTASTFKYNASKSCLVEEPTMETLKLYRDYKDLHNIRWTESEIKNFEAYEEHLASLREIPTYHKDWPSHALIEGEHFVTHGTGCKEFPCYCGYGTDEGDMCKYQIKGAVPIPPSQLLKTRTPSTREMAALNKASKRSFTPSQPKESIIGTISEIDLDGLDKNEVLLIGGYTYIKKEKVLMMLLKWKLENSPSPPKEESYNNLSDILYDFLKFIDGKRTKSNLPLNDDLELISDFIETLPKEESEE